MAGCNIVERKCIICDKLFKSLGIVICHDCMCPTQAVALNNVSKGDYVWLQHYGGSQFRFKKAVNVRCK